MPSDTKWSKLTLNHKQIVSWMCVCILAGGRIRRRTLGIHEAKSHTLCRYKCGNLIPWAHPSVCGHWGDKGLRKFRHKEFKKHEENWRNRPAAAVNDTPSTKDDIQ